MSSPALPAADDGDAASCWAAGLVVAGWAPVSGAGPLAVKGDAGLAGVVWAAPADAASSATSDVPTDRRAAKPAICWIPAMIIPFSNSATVF